MSEGARKDFTDKASEKMTPNDSKSTVDKISEGVSDTADKAQRDLMPDDQKSTTQSLGDKASREKDSHSSSNQGGSIIDSAKDMLGMNK
ncbi:hypothetical protein BAUCODRAFT_145325 [Baudoinia panamericana UAMH 10762]|uniref:Chaperone/heat shock protein Hsp12 n=1 Tax=Baudoinia panamericana (strain UAMH 10762) TaxID=717646 RepID=M2N7E2_BAUPA|nr:uncharacterized protein BAUCODRAFT_145325 [Baudoinia panamericana UAMH 10762]EMC99998.1 hypothetical protein BAUCODRAFT_145325 [Baudoinia panamericana UAMH 10762]